MKNLRLILVRLFDRLIDIMAESPISNLHNTFSSSASLPVKNLGNTFPSSMQMLSKPTANIQVAVRCRPLSNEEKKSNQPSVVTCDSENNIVKVAYGPVGKKTPRTLAFDKVFGMYSRQDEIFDTIVKPIVDEAINGYNCTIFAYGPTGTGKTYTMEGDIYSEEFAGMIPRTARMLVDTLERAGIDYSLKASFLEIYNEELQDLLSMNQDKRLKLCEDLKRGVVCQNLEEVSLHASDDVLDLLKRGIINRQTSATTKNQNSSRSHAIFTFRITLRESAGVGEETVRTGQLNLVDLAGSECIGRSGAKNDRAREAGSINQSLLTLGRVITALVDHHSHIPYRDSKLTRLLQESLGGRARTCIIATLSPAQSSLEETMSTLDYAFRAKNIKNQPTMNSSVNQKVVVKEYFAEMEALKVQLIQAREKNGVYMDPTEYYAKESKLATQESQLLECEVALRQRDDEIRAMKAERVELQSKIYSLLKQLEVAESNYEELKRNFTDTKHELHETFLELKATEAIVEEQAETEKNLTQQSHDFLAEIGEKHEDVDKLYGKIDRIIGKESERMQSTLVFVQNINGNTSALVDQVSSLALLSRTRADYLYQSVDQILTQSRGTCNTLKASIDQALTILLTDAETAKESVAGSCTELRTHLNSTNAQLEHTLRGLQNQLSAWLASVDGSLRDCQSQVNIHQTKVNETVDHLSKYTSSISAEANEFMKAQNDFNQNMVLLTGEMLCDVKHDLQAHKQTAKQKAQEAVDLLRSKAEALEMVVVGMLKDLMTGSAMVIEASSAATTKICEDTENQLSQGMEHLAALQKEAHQSVQAHVQKVANDIDEAKIVTTQDMDALKSINDRTIGLLTDSRGNTSTKKEDLEETVSILLTDIDEALSQGSNIIQRTSESSETIVKELSNATQKLKGSNSQAFHSFVTSMNDGSEEMLRTLHEHFEMIELSSQTQQNGLSILQSQALQHREFLQSTILRPRGDTPMKSPQRKSPPELCATRSHEQIKAERKEMLLKKLEEHLLLLQQQSGTPSNGEAASNSPLIAITTTGASPVASSRTSSPQSSIRPLNTADSISMTTSSPTSSFYAPNGHN